ncbi:MAG TPA: GNAT family N-acetyltransferase [Pseudonocardia sp.]|nr:GNAT family N-acetyltransferase [Pseudonocardia sp.]
MVELREATPADALDIAAVHVESWQVGYRGLIPDDVLAGLSVESREQWWRQTLSVPGLRGTLVAVQDTAVLGFVSVGADHEGDPTCGELYAIYLRPTSWRRGVGSALHAAALARLRALGFDRASLWMLAGNERALRFYRRLGWAEDGRRKVVDGPGGVRMDHRGLGRRLAPPVSGEPC